MVYGSLTFITLLLFLKSYGVVAQCPGLLDFLSPSSNIPSTAYIQPVGQVCFPAVIQIQDNVPPPPAPQQDDDDDYLNLIYLLISALTGSKKGSNSNPNQNYNNNGRNPKNQNDSPGFNPFSALIPNNNKNLGPNSGCIDITSLINGPIFPGPNSSPYSCSNTNPNPITISIDTSGAGTGCLCEACNSNNPFSHLNLFPGNQPTNAPSTGYNSYGPPPNFIPDTSNSGNGCIYVPYPVPVPYNVPGYNFDNIYFPDGEYGPQEIKLIINTEID